MKTHFRFFVLLSIIAMCVSCSAKSELNDTGRGRADDNPTVAADSSPKQLPGGIMVIFQDRKSNYWFGGSENGVYRYDGENLVLFTTADGLVDHSVIGIQEDKAGSLYFDTRVGVSKYDGQQFTTLEVVENIDGRNEWQLQPDDLWFRMGWDRDGPYRYDGEKLYALAFPHTEMVDEFYAQFPNSSYKPSGVYSYYRDRRGAVWFGTASLGVFRYDGETLSWLYEEQLSKTPEGGDFGIRSILEDQAGDFWFCNSHYRFAISAAVTAENQLDYERKAGVGYTDETGVERFPFYMSITEDERGDLWMATYDEGVWRKTGDRLLHYPVKRGEETVTIFSIYQDRAGGLWLGTHNAGVYQYDGEGFVPFEL